MALRFHDEGPGERTGLTDGGLWDGGAKRRHFDVAVIGSGLAAAAAAACAAQLGMQVVALRRPGPPPEVGEILDHRAVAVLEETQLLTVAETAIGDPVGGLSLCWPPLHDRFQKLKLRGRVVNVRRLTELLWQYARQLGASMVEAPLARGSSSPRDVATPWSGDMSPMELMKHTAFMLDASGAGGDGRGMARRFIYVNRAVHAVGYRLANGLAEPEGLKVLALPNGWSYSIDSFGPRVAGATFFRPAHEEDINASLMASRVLGGRAGSRVVAAVARPLRCGLSFAERCHGPDWIAIGAAALGLDPLSGKGMTWALESARAAVHALKKENGLAAGLREYENLWLTALHDTHAEALHHYGACARTFDTPFWNDAYLALQNTALPSRRNATMAAA